MKVVLVLLGVFLLCCCSPAHCNHTELVAQIQEATRKCALLNDVTPEQFGQLRTLDSYEAISEFSPTNNLQCFMKCILEKSELVVHPKGIQAERFVEVGVLHGRQADRLRFKIKYCSSLYMRDMSCSDAWVLYSCLSQ